MKVLLIGNYPPDQQYSLLGFRNALADGLRAAGVEARVLVPEARAVRLKSPPGLRKWLGYVDKLVLFPRALRRALGWADLVHMCEHSSAVYTRHLGSKPNLVTCHDMMGIKSALGEIPEWPTGGTGRVYQRMILGGMLRARHVACISQTTRADLLRIGGLPQERATLIYNGQFYPFRKMPEAESGPRLERLGVPAGDPFLMHIGQNSPTKNRQGALEIFRAFREASGGTWRLVMAGKPLPPPLRDYVERNGLGGQVLERPDLESEDICALYSRAQALVFPSLYEGFGMPIIEAQSCGCPVFTSNRAPMTEVGGAAAVYFDPQDVSGAAHTVLSRLTCKEPIIAAGYENVKRFTTERMISEYAALYAKVA